LESNYENEAPLMFYDYAEVAKRPNFRPEIDTSKHKIEKIISKSIFPDKHPCGKKDCHQPHKNGWVVETVDNLETLVGSKCGLEWGGDTFLSQIAALDKRIKRESKLKIISEFIQNTDLLIERVHEIKTRTNGALWLSKTITRLETECTEDIFRNLKRRAAKGETSVTKDVLKTKEERELESSMNVGVSSSAYKTLIIGHLDGLEVLNFDIRQILIQKIYSTVISLKHVNPSTLSTPALNKLSLELGEIDTLFLQAEDILGYGKKFFSNESNFKLIKALDIENKHGHLTKINWMDNT